MSGRSMKMLMRAIAVLAAMAPPTALTLHATTAEAAPPAPSASPAVCASLKIDTAADADVRAVEKGIAMLLGCKDVARDPALAYWTDGPAVSQLARLAVVSDCLPTELDRPTDLIEALRCYPDLQLLDRAKLDVELDADPRFDAPAKATLRQAMDGARARAETWRKQAAALVAKNPEARAVLFDAPSKALTDWHTAYAANKDGIDAALALSAKVGTDAGRGCSVPMQRHLSVYVAKKDARTIASATTAMSDSMGYAMVEALARCEQADGEALAAQSLNDTVLAKTTEWHRGPRVAAYWAAVDAIDASDAAQRLFGASFRVFRRFPRDRPQIVARSAQEHEEVVATVRAVTGGARVTFASLGAAPVIVATAHANGLTPGQKMIYVLEGRSSTHAFPLSVYADTDKKNAVAFMGTPLAGAPSTPPPAAAPDRIKVRRAPRR